MVFKLPALKLPASREARDIDSAIQTLDSLVRLAEDVSVTCPQELARAHAFLERIDTTISVVDELSDRFRVPAYEYYKSVLTEKNRQLEGPQQARTVLRSKIREYMIGSGFQSDDFHMRDNWQAEVVDLEALVHDVANGKAPIELLTINKTFANEIAKTLKGEMNYAGLKSKNEKTLAKTNAKATRK